MKMSPKLRAAVKAMSAARLRMPKRSAADANAQVDHFLKDAGAVLDDGATDALLNAISQGKSQMQELSTSCAIPGQHE